MNEEQLSLVEDLGEFSKDPYGFVLWAFPWGEPGTELENFSGPEPWQAKLLIAVRDGLMTLNEALRFATTSGHGVGKSALCSWLVWWGFSTREKTRGVVTANTENQLKTKTWVEIAKWHRLFIARELFKCTATAIFSTDDDLAREWRIDIVPWSERNTEAFAGLHNQGNRILIIFDEASNIPAVIWEVTEGAMTDKDTEILWFVFGNPTVSTGRFRDCFPGGKFSQRWQHFKVDSREVRFTNKEQIDRWIKDYGIDSDFVRVRILGEFPHVDSSSFISLELANSAIGRPLERPPELRFAEREPLYLGVDVARYGRDSSVAWPRRGRDACSIPPRTFSGLSLTQLAFRVAAFAQEIEADAIFVDGTGVGGGVVDALIDLGLPVYDIQFGARPDNLDDGVQYANKRAEIWGLMKKALAYISLPRSIPNYEGVLAEELSGPEYIVNQAGKIQLESKEMMARRGVASPDAADALALTFSLPLPASLPLSTSREAPYNPYSEERLYANR